MASGSALAPALIFVPRMSALSDNAPLFSYNAKRRWDPISWLYVALLLLKIAALSMIGHINPLLGKEKKER